MTISRSTNFAARLFLAAAAAAFSTTPAAAIVLGQVDNFNNGMTAGWQGSGTNVVDSALNVVSTNRVVTFNIEQWTGNYTAAGVDTIRVDVKNPNPFDMQMRIGIASNFGLPASQGFGDTYVTNYAITVPHDNEWHTISFSIKPTDFVPHVFHDEAITPNPAAALAALGHFRFLHNPLPDFRGIDGGANWQLDNITAAAATPAEDADFDNDMDVDGADFLTWQRGVGGAGGNGVGDANADNAVNGQDFTIWQRQFAEPTAAMAVPEPNSAVGGLLIAALAASRRRR